GQVGGTWASARGENAYETDYYQLFQEREREATLAADGLVTLGEQMKKNLIQFGAKAEDIVLSPNAVGGRFLHEPGDTTAARNELGLRSEEHTSELQSRFDLVCRLLLEKNTQ